MLLIDLDTARLQKQIDDLQAQVNDLAHRLNQAIVSLQSQLDDKVNAEPGFQP
jgi:cell division septum initiation protein DivIVA